MFLHHAEELDDDLGAGSDQDLALSGLLGVVDGLERIVENGGPDHFGSLRFSDRLAGNEVSAMTYMLAFMGIEHRECPHGGRRVLRLIIEERCVSVS
jgi:hypothetical protein